MTRAVVVGGGIAGILSALLLKNKFDDVCLIEKENELGGLLRSIQSKDGLYFDYGTHILRETGNADLDEIMLFNKENYYALPYLKAGNYALGHLNEDSPFINTNFLPKDVYQKGLTQLMETSSIKNNPENGLDSLNQTIGAEFTDKVMKPALQKLYGESIAELDPHAHILFALGRILVESPEKTKELKKDPVLDAKIGFHSFKDGLSSQRNYYPKSGGVGAWVVDLTTLLLKKRVRLILGEMIQKIEQENEVATTLHFNNGDKLEFDEMIWTTPLFQFQKAAGIDFKGVPPQIRGVEIYHYVFDKPFLTDLNYFYNYDLKFQNFRVTLYPNIHSENKNLFHCTVEVLTSQNEDKMDAKEKYKNELVEIGIIDKSSHIHDFFKSEVKNGFPVLTKDFVQQCRDQHAFVDGKFKNVAFVGRAKGSAFFMNDVLLETFQLVRERYGIRHERVSEAVH